MKRFLALLLCLLLLPALCACGGEKAEAPQRETLSVPGVDAASGAWIGRGGCFRLEPCEDGDSARSTFSYEGQEYRFYDGWDGSRITRGDETIYETKNVVSGVRPAEQGIWVAEEIRDGNDWYEHFTLLSGSGDERYSLHIKLPADSFPRTFALDGDALILNCSDALRLYDTQGESLAVIPHAEWAGGILTGSDGTVYFVDEERLGGGSVSSIDVEGSSFRELFTYERGSICRGDDSAPFLLIHSEGVDRVQSDGSASPLVIWAECGLSVSGLLEVKAQPDGSYLLTGFASPMRMLPAEPSELKARIRLTLGVITLGSEQVNFAMGNESLIRSVSDFNAWSTDCYVELLDLCEDGTLNAEQAQMKLNTQILAGESPDMLVFGNGKLSPFPFLRRGLLREMDAEFIESDPEIRLEDIVTAPMLQKDLGGLYLLGGSFYIESRCGLQERFGEVWGWDYDTYRRIDRETPEGSMVMYNLTRDYFFRESASRFLRRAVDWQSGSCDFDNGDFVKLLEACRDMRETPEDPNNLVFGLSSDLMNGGYIVTSLCMFTAPEEYARDCREMGKPIRFIGFPTPDASCGTDLNVVDTIGILTGSEHPLECWKFVKHCLLHSERDLSAYRPLLEAQVAEAQRAKGEDEADPLGMKLDPPMSDAEVRGFYELLGHIEHTTLYDSAALDIVREEFAAVMAGDKSPQEAAGLVQSRVSLYVAEQS